MLSSRPPYLPRGMPCRPRMADVSGDQTLRVSAPEPYPCLHLTLVPELRGCLGPLHGGAEEELRPRETAPDPRVSPE